MIYQFGKNLITKQKHIHLSKLAELLKMKLGKAVLGRLYLKGCRTFFSPFSLMVSLHQGSPSSTPSSATTASVLNLNAQPQAPEFTSSHRWQTLARTYKPFVKQTKSLCPQSCDVCLMLWNDTWPGNTGRCQQDGCYVPHGQLCPAIGGQEAHTVAATHEPGREGSAP